jgi:hypothetical protein
MKDINQEYKDDYVIVWNKLKYFRFIKDLKILNCYLSTIFSLYHVGCI